jgi:hypothetical protein
MMRWSAIFPNEQAESPTMERLALLDNRLLGVYLHRFPASPHSPLVAAHDHPWHFVSLVLRGGYDETCCAQHWEPRRRGDVSVRWARTVHRIRVHTGGALTLCVRGPKTQDWSYRRLPG